MKRIIILFILTGFLAGCGQDLKKEESVFINLSKTEKACLEDLSLPYSVDADYTSVKCLFDRGSVIIYPDYSFREMPDSIRIRDDLIEIKTSDSGPQRKDVCIQNQCLEINYRKNGEFLNTLRFEK